MDVVPAEVLAAELGAPPIQELLSSGGKVAPAVVVSLLQSCSAQSITAHTTAMLAACTCCKEPVITALWPGSGAQCGVGVPGWCAAAVDGSRDRPAARRGVEVTRQVAAAANRGVAAGCSTVACTQTTSWNASACIWFGFRRCQHSASALTTFERGSMGAGDQSIVSDTRVVLQDECV
jgi:hypothetical protein